MRNLFTQLFQQVYSNQTNERQSRDYRDQVITRLRPGNNQVNTPFFSTRTMRAMRYVAAIAMMMVLSIGNVWGDDRGFWDSGSGSVRFYRNGSSEYWANVNKNSVSDFSLGNIDSDGGLIWTDTWTKVWGGTDIFNSITFYYRVKGQDAGEGPSYSNYDLTWNNNFDGTNQYWDRTMLSQTCSTTGLAAGNYEVEFYWTGAGKDGNTYYLSNNGGNYHANFTLRRKITYHTDGSTEGSAPSTEWFSGAATVRDNTGLLRRSDGYVFAGWADSKSRADAGNIDHEPGSSNMSVTLTADLDLYPVWRPGYYLISLAGAGKNGTKDGTNFIAAQSLNNTQYTVNGVTFSKSHYPFGSTGTAYNVAYASNAQILYDTKTDNEDLFIYAISSSGTNNLYYTVIKDGLTCSQETLSVSTSGVVKKIPVAHSKSSRVVIAVANTNIKITNIKVVKHGSTLPAPCTAGYQLSFPGRPGTGKTTAYTIDGITLYSKADLKFGNGSMKLSSTSTTEYIQFAPSTAIQLQVKISANKHFSVCTNRSSAANVTATGEVFGGTSGTTYNINLSSAGTYYIVGHDGDLTIDKISFADYVACTAPTGLSAGSTTYNGTTFTVTDGINANNYEFYVSTSSTAPTASTTPTYTSTSKTKVVDDLNKNTTYYAWVRTSGGRFYKSAWTALTGTTFKTLDAYDITYNCDGAESGCPSATAGIALPNPLPNAPYKPGYVFAGWYTNSAKTVSAVAGASISENTTLYAKWTKVYASGTYQFDGHLTVGSSPSKTVTGSEVSYDAFCVDNIFFSGTKIQFEGTDGTPYGDGDDYKGWKIKASTTIKFFVEDDSDVEVSIGSIGGGSATVTYTNQSGVLQSNTTHTAGAVVTYKADAGTMVTITCSPSSGKSVTLKRIKITATASCYAPTSPSISGTTAYDAGDNISLTASATGTSGSTTYQWYKGDPENGGVSQGAASTSGATYTKNSCVVGDAGTYYCVISNGEGCTVTTSQAITVACLTAPVAVTSLTCSAQTTSSLTYTWTKASNASGYVAKLWDNSSCTGDAVATQNLGDVATVTFSTLSASTTYYCKVQSKGNGTVYCVDGGTTSAVSGTTSTPTYTVSITVNPAGYGSVSASSVSSVTSGTTLSASTNTLSVGATDVTATAADATAEYTYAFSNWTKSDGTALPSTVTANLSVYANFTRTANSYTLTWDLAGGTVTTAGTGAAVDATGTPSSSVAYGTAITAPVVTKSGYDFAGWSSTPAGTMPAANTTYTATWAQKYTVTYNYNGATSGASPASATAASVTLPTPTRTSYVLDGWYTTAGTKVGDGGDTYNPTADITLYARWEESCAAGGAEIRFLSSNKNDAGNNFASMSTSSNTTQLVGGGLAKLIAIGNADLDNSASDKKIGYRFDSRCEFIFKFTATTALDIYITATGSSNRTCRLASFSSDKALADIVSSDHSSKTTVSTNVSASGSTLGGITSGNASVSSGVVTITNSGGIKISYTSLPAGYYVFYGGSSTMHVSGFDSSTGGGSGTCYHVYYHGNGAESGFVSDTTSYANSATATILDFDDSRYPLTKAGYTFQGWATSAGGSVAKTAGQTVTISSADVHYYAVWAVAAPTYDITNGNPSHGTISISDGSSAITEAEEDATVHISATPADGYSFGEWTVTKDASGDPVSVSTSSTANPATFTMPAEAVTVTASFSPNTYDITYHLNGASWASAAGVAEYTVGTGATLPLASAMTNTGYTFAGWKNNSSLTGDTYTSVSTSDYGNKEFWAKWTENTYTVTYDKNGGSGDAMSNTVGHYVTLSDNAYTAPSGKTFVEWNTATDGSGASYNEGEEVELTDDLDLYAIWANDFDVNWTITKIDSKLYRGGGGYTVTAVIDDASWDASASDADKLELSATDGVTLRNITNSINGSGKAQITANFDITTEVEEDATQISFTLSVPANNGYGAKEDVDVEDLDACSGGGDPEIYYSYTISSTSTVTDASATGGTFTSYNNGSTLGSASGFYKLGNNDIAKSYFIINTTQTIAVGDRISVTTNSTEFDLYTSAGVEVADNVTTYYTVVGGDGIAGTKSFKIGRHDSGSQFKTFTVASIASSLIEISLIWETDLSGGVNTETGAADFTHTVTQDMNSLGAITYASSNTSVVTVNATSGKVHVVGAGDATITATIAESGCYEEATATYTIHVEDNCEDVAGTISTENLGCDGIRMTVTGHTAEAGVTYQWYKDGVSLGSGSGAQTATYTAIAAGEYYVIVDNTAAEGDHCAKASTNSVIIEAMEAATATKIVDEWYVKNGRRTPDIALVQTTNATGFIVKSGSTTIWNSDSTTTTGFGGCGFHMDENGIIYLNGTKDNGDATTDLSAGNETLTFTAKACGGDASVNITIHKQAATDYKTIAFVVDGTKDGAWDAVTSGHADGTMLYEYLDSVGTAASARKFMLYERNIYKTTDEKTIRQHYSQFDAILITDDPNTQTVPSKGDDYTKKGYVNAIGSLIDIRPVLTMEAYVSALENWKAKGINGNPSSPNLRQYAMKLDCKNHAIFTGINSSSSNVEVEDIDDVEYWTVIMVDSIKSPYDKHAYNDSTSQYPALQGFEASDVSDLMLLGEISEGTLYAGVERQEEPAARLLLLGLNNKALPNALTPEGKKIIENALSYLIETDMERVDDCSNYFTGATSTDWNTASNWSKGLVPNSPYVKARILSPCVVNSGTYKVASIDIATSGRSINKAGTINGSLTINAGAALIIGGRVRSAKAPYFNKGDLKPTEAADLVLNTSSTNQAALIFNNDKGDTKATVNLYSLGRKESGAYQFQYMAVPMNYIDVNPAFAGSGIYTYVWKEPSNGWERRAYYAGLSAFEGVGITTKSGSASNYTLQGALTSTTEKAIQLTTEGSGQNIIGNSWTAPIDIASLRTALVGEDVDKTIYIYCAGNDGVSVHSGATETAGQWLAIPIEAAAWDAWGGLKVIPAMQAFCIKANTGTTLTLNYKDHVRSTASAQLNQPLRAPKREAEQSSITLTNIRVADSKTHTDLYLFEGEKFSEEFDNGWEAKYMSGDGRSAKLYAETEIGNMAVAALPELEGTILGFAPGKETEYTFSFSGAENGYYLNDLKLKQSTLIEVENSYGFTFEEGDTNRFYISRTPIDKPEITTDVENAEGETLKPHKILYNDKLYILFNGRVFDATGKVVK